MLSQRNAEAASPDKETEGKTKSSAGDETGTQKSSSDRGGKKPRRINVAVTPEIVDAIELVMEKEDISLTEAVRRLMSYGDFIYRTVRQDRSEILVRNGDNVKEVVLLT